MYPRLHSGQINGTAQCARARWLPGVLARSSAKPPILERPGIEYLGVSPTYVWSVYVFGEGVTSFLRRRVRAPMVKEGALASFKGGIFSTP